MKFSVAVNIIGDNKQKITMLEKAKCLKRYVGTVYRDVVCFPTE